jgi:hypothetical protein
MAQNKNPQKNMAKVASKLPIKSCRIVEPLQVASLSLPVWSPEEYKKGEDSMVSSPFR